MLALVAAWLPAPGAGQPTPPAGQEGLAEWAAGPVRWLLLPAEQRQLREITGPGAAIGFIERFWAVRDPSTSGSRRPTCCTRKGTCAAA